MNTLRNPFLWLATAVVAILCTASSCRPNHAGVGVNASPLGTNITADVGWDISSNATANVHAEVDPATGNWSGGVVITFKETPNAEVLAALQRAGAQSVLHKDGSPFAVYEIRGFDFKNPKHIAALEAAQSVGARWNNYR